MCLVGYRADARGLQELAALGRIAVESVPQDRVGMGSGANNTARYLGGAAGVALVVTLASGKGQNGLIHGWNTAAFVSAGLCGFDALIVASCRARGKQPDRCELKRTAPHLAG